MTGPCFLLLGPPGAGKGTQARRLAEATGGLHLSSGELLRAAVEAGNELGQQVAPFLAGGQLVPTDLVFPLIEEAVEGARPEQPLLFDGFPRRVEQAHLLEEMLARHERVLQQVLFLEVPQELLRRRLLARGRADDTPEVIEERLEVYERETAPLLAYYRARQLLRVVDGSGSVEEVTARLLQEIQP